MKTKHTTPELLAPAGEPDSGYAALEYGADALYLGMNRFSARAEAVNFSPDELADLAGYAHGMTPRRNIYLTLNTLVKQSELADAAATLLEAAACGVDAVIVQDLGVAKLVRERFPSLKLHASTQMAVHSLEGALAARELGCRRVTLARELPLAEIRNIVDGVGPEMEVETFIHGTLCYSYSGLCLFSSLLAGRSGNRGRCIYSCREAADTPAGRTHPFSLKDMALGERVLDLAAIGVASLKIEGRKKSPLYVAATVDHYRRILDGKLSGGAIRENEARLKTIFARPWTTFFLDSKRNPDAADPDVVGHRGSRIGSLDRLLRTPAGKGIAFTASMAVERHDGLQVDLPGEARPFGFAVDSLYTVKGNRMESVFEAPAGAMLAVPLPDDSPALAPGLPLYLSSSQAVKRAFPFARPKAGAFLPRRDIRVEIEIRKVEGDAESRAAIVCEAIMDAPKFWRDAGGEAESAPLRQTVAEQVPAYAARDDAGPEKAARAAFERLGDSRFHLEGWRFSNPDKLFVKPGDWNRLRRQLTGALENEWERRANSLRHSLDAAMNPPVRAAETEIPDFTWSVFADRIDFLSAFTDDDFARCGEVIVTIAGGMRETVSELAKRIGPEKLRFAIPLILREESVPAITNACFALLDAGWRRWMVSGLAGWRLVRNRTGLSLAADWPFNALNRQTVEHLAEMGLDAFTLSPEDDADNMARLAASYRDRATAVAFSHLPLFISAACAHSHLGLCGKGASDCRKNSSGMKMTMERGAQVEIIPQACGSVVVGEKHYSLSPHLPRLARIGVTNLRVDFRWRNYRPEEAVALWRRVRAGDLPGGIDGNFLTGLL